jgi:hypothetical protein
LPNSCMGHCLRAPRHRTNPSRNITRYGSTVNGARHRPIDLHLGLELCFWRRNLSWDGGTRQRANLSSARTLSSLEVCPELITIGDFALDLIDFRIASAATAGHCRRR